MKPLITELWELPPDRKWDCVVNAFAGWQMAEFAAWLWHFAQ